MKKDKQKNTTKEPSTKEKGIDMSSLDALAKKLGSRKVPAPKTIQVIFPRRKGRKRFVPGETVRELRRRLGRGDQNDTSTPYRGRGSRNGGSFSLGRFKNVEAIPNI